jgi:hypothetical protein
MDTYPPAGPWQEPITRDSRSMMMPEEDDPSENITRMSLVGGGKSEKALMLLHRLRYRD